MSTKPYSHPNEFNELLGTTAGSKPVDDQSSSRLARELHLVGNCSSRKRSTLLFAVFLICCMRISDAAFRSRTSLRPQLFQIRLAKSAGSPAPPFTLPNCSLGLKSPFVLTPTSISETNGLRVLVDFIVNKQGYVESPFIVEGSGETNERLVLQIIREWRFPPPVCNDAEIDVEVLVLFVSPRKRLPRPT